MDFLRKQFKTLAFFEMVIFASLLGLIVTMFVVAYNREPIECRGGYVFTRTGYRGQVVQLIDEHGHGVKCQ